MIPSIIGITVIFASISVLTFFLFLFLRYISKLSQDQ
ncbi:hypothetical protein JOD01_000948 [Brevibacillus fulvus]|uniref:Uncharacterized protein n=1 Tax=Brevibacillus fulvus TaxID=1125967 RepID=A0A939BNN4_9BACL|nr:hypothetical protein [Brevibacillus fulvus]